MHIISQWYNYEELHFAHDAAPPYFVQPVNARLDNQFCGWWIGLKDQWNVLCVISFWRAAPNEKV